jgi:hypothetical protein
MRQNFIGNIIHGQNFITLYNEILSGTINTKNVVGGSNIFGVFRVKNHDFMPKNVIFSNCGGRREHFWVFRVKNHDLTPKKSYFFPILGGRGTHVSPPWIRGVQHYVIKFVSDLRQVGGFLQVLRFPPPIKLTVYCNLNIMFV